MRGGGGVQLGLPTRGGSSRGGGGRRSGGRPTSTGNQPAGSAGNDLTQAEKDVLVTLIVGEGMERQEALHVIYQERHQRRQDLEKLLTAGPTSTQQY